MDWSQSDTSSSTEPFCELWGCELSDTQRKVVVERSEDELLEHQFYIHSMCLSAEASAELHIVEVQDKTRLNSKPVPIASLHPLCQPTVTFNGLELTPPVTFRLSCGRGPLFILGQHVTLEPVEEQKILHSSPSPN